MANGYILDPELSLLDLEDNLEFRINALESMLMSYACAGDRTKLEPQVLEFMHHIATEMKEMFSLYMEKRKQEKQQAKVASASRDGMDELFELCLAKCEREKQEAKAA